MTPSRLEQAIKQIFQVTDPAVTGPAEHTLRAELRRILSALVERVEADAWQDGWERSAKRHLPDGIDYFQSNMDEDWIAYNFQPQQPAGHP